ncbi:MAG: hypothetical protein JSV64_05035 [Candidatus Bathyarchaeota archaeon]|nr:MAG: hypothetical protein JSV64_05035 [Candidatus Bathyarchaeota archaeon]
MPDNTARKIKQLEEKLKPIVQQRHSFNEEMNRWVDKRDSIHKQINDLRDEALKLRAKRDEINAEVNALKTYRDGRRLLITEKLQKINKLKGKLPTLSKKKPKETASDIMKRKEKIEWKIQTSSLTLEEEKPLVKEADSLETQLDILRKIETTRNEIGRLRKEIDAIEEEANRSHTELLKLASKSQNSHSKMQEFLKKARSLQKEADRYHRSVLQMKRKSNEIHQFSLKIRSELQALKRQVRESKETEKVLRHDETLKKLRAETLRKLKQGEKLTIEELKLLGEEDIQ